MDYYTDWRRLPVPPATQEFRQGHLRAVSLLEPHKIMLGFLDSCFYKEITLMTIYQ